jgi:hypothetical protein
MWGVRLADVYPVSMCERTNSMIDCGRLAKAHNVVGLFLWSFISMRLAAQFTLSNHTHILTIRAMCLRL